MIKNIKIYILLYSLLGLLLSGCSSLPRSDAPSKVGKLKKSPCACLMITIKESNYV